MRVQRIGLPVALALLCALAACHRAAKPDEKAAGAAPALRARDFYPLAVGHEWTYEVEGGGVKARKTVTIVREDRGFFVDSAGGALRFDAAGLRDPDRYLLLEPLEVGHKWSSIQGVRSTERYEIIEAGRPCATEAGTFGRCLRVRASNALDLKRTLVNETTYAEGVGLVELRSLKQENGAQELQFTVRLVGYRLAP